MAVIRRWSLDNNNDIAGANRVANSDLDLFDRSGFVGALNLLRELLYQGF